MLLVFNMENKPLNMAHQQHRRADNYMRTKKFDDAMQCHHNAAELLIDAMKSTSSTRAIESISTLHSFHIRQKELIKAKKEQHDRIKKTIENIKHLSRDPLYQDTQLAESNVQVAIYRNINEADSLLEILKKPEQACSSENINDDNIVVGTDALTEMNASKSSSNKKVQDRQSTIEALQSLGLDLHDLVDRLMVQVELIKDENSTLKDRVDNLEMERRKYLSVSNQMADLSQNTPLAMLTAANYSPDENSDYSFPPNEFRAESVDRCSERATPVDRPNFDLTAFKDDVSTTD